MRPTSILLVLAFGAGGALAGWSLAPRQPERTPAPVIIERVREVNVPHVRDALVEPAAPPAGDKAEAAEPGEEAPDRAPAPEQMAAARECARVLDTALAAGRWTPEDREAMRAGLGQVGGDDRLELLRRMAVAFNQGRLRIETAGPPI